MPFLWDAKKRSQNLERHDIDFAIIEGFVWSTAMVVATHGSKHGGRRFKATGLIEGRLHTVVFAWLGTEAVSIISLRPASRKERREYEDREATETSPDQ